MKKILLAALILLLSGTAAQAALTPGRDYYLWLNIYEKLIGTNEAGNGPAISAYGVQPDGYVFTAEESGRDGYVLLRQKSTGRYLAASSANAWSMVFESTRSTDSRFLWAADEGTYVYLKCAKNSQFLGVDGANKSKQYVSIFYDKPQGSHSQWSIIPATGQTWDDARAAYASAEYTNAQGVREVDYCLLRDAAINRSDAIDIHVTANSSPIQGSTTINLGSDRTWLIIDNITPSEVISKYLKYVRIQGQAAADGKNCRVAIYLNGAAVIPSPSGSVLQAKGTHDFQLNAGNHKDLGANTNAMTSFTLRRGYMATLASGTNGSGHSHVYVADHADLQVNLPAALAYRVSSVNIKPWQYLSKKGWADTGGATKGPQLRATWYWSWSAGYNSTRDMEFVPCRQHIYWPSANEVNSKTASAAFSLNEPEHSEQHTSSKCSCGGTISEWNAYLLSPDFQAGGGRIGSPQPTDFSYLTKFCKYVDENNNQSRCDFVVTHAYWNISGRNATDYANWFVNQCKNAWNNTHRPLWITEMEVGSSWGDQLSSYDKYREYLQVLLQKLDDNDFIERYAIYAFDFWRAYMFYDDGSPTPAGEVYRDHRSTFAYHAAYTKDPVWWTPGVKKPGISVTYDSQEQLASFIIENANTDMTSKLVIESSTDGNQWSAVATIEDRQLFENSTIELDDVEVGLLPMGTQFRVVMTTLTGATSTSDVQQTGSLVNGNIVAESKSSIKGWTCVRGAQNGYTKADSGDTYFEVWHPTAEGVSFDYYQDISGLQNGVYRLQANVFNSTNNVATATVNGAVGLYAQSGTTTWFAPVTKDTEMDNAELLSIGNIVVTDGTLRVGVRNLKAMTARWAGADNFALSYLGEPEEILDMEPEEALKQAQKDFLQLLPAEGQDAYDFTFFLHNPEATSSTEGWTTSNVEIKSGESYDNKNSDPKNTYFDKWGASSYTSTLEQAIAHMPAGDYELTAMLRGSASFPLTFSLSAGTQTRKITFTGKGAEDNANFPKGWEEVSVGEMTIDQEGTLKIVLTGTGTSWWSADHFRLIYSPEKEPDPTPGPTPEPQPNELAFTTDVVQAKMGEAVTPPSLSNPHDLPVSWESEDEEIATVDQEGNITLVSPGTTVISATFAGNDDYLAGTVAYTLHIDKADPVPCELAFSAEEAEAELGEAFEVPTLTNPHQVPITWTSSDETVATVDAEGKVTLVGPGSATITASFEGNDDYLPAAVSYTLTVTKYDGITSTAATSKAQVITLTGIRLNTSAREILKALKPGVYLINGRKVVIK